MAWCMRAGQEPSDFDKNTARLCPFYSLARAPCTCSRYSGQIQALPAPRGFSVLRSCTVQVSTDLWCGHHLARDLSSRHIQERLLLRSP